MNRFVIGFFAALLIMGGIWLFTDSRTEKAELQANSAMIQQQIQQVGKLIVTEANYSQVFTYNNSQKLFLNLVSANKKALIVAKAKATVEYDLRQMETKVDEENKTVTIVRIPDPVINVYPEFEYYDVTQDYLNPFEGKDYNKIKTSITAQFRKKIDESGLKEDAQDRLMSELLNIYILTKSMGWTLVYNEEVIENPEQMNNLKK
ncbi:DUF4230 domain-containing protein [Algoriphagus sp. D3-2-R+10]|uniref:DUF4230 domain-containing protein n=1 Tax=Algoriphagus aurantiacus TaxID=3103948 RepID=UPI002B399464|nr:DUF4230 domain-containing protein [Algoriphagus sp. D3-2-R+10]MEB2775202.1 DUF4230 domain-containing protein [Algoriphagus sp. D3-2-R+10]